MCSIKPNNHNDIKELLISDLSDINRKMIKKTVIFYDTCSLSNHARKNIVTNKFDMLDYFSEDDLIIITDKILEEMVNTSTGEISSQYINFLKELKQKVNNIILLSECELENLLALKFNNKTHVKNKIHAAVKTACSDVSQKDSKKIIFDDEVIYKKDFLKTIFSAVDVAKKNRGEISILICLLVLENIKVKNFRILTDDAKSLNYLRRPFDNGRTKSNLAIESTPKIIQNLCNSKIWSNKKKNEIIDILDVVRNDQSNKIAYNKIIEGIKYENVIKETMTNQQLACNIYKRIIEVVF